MKWNKLKMQSVSFLFCWKSISVINGIICHKSITKSRKVVPDCITEHNTLKSGKGLLLHWKKATHFNGHPRVLWAVFQFLIFI